MSLLSRCRTAASIGSAMGISIAGAAAQERATWRLAPHSVAIYERQSSCERSPESEAFWGPFVREANPPLLFADELTPDRRALSEPIQDIRDLGRHAAFHLASFARPGVQRFDIALLNSLMPMRAELRFEAPASDGAQRASGTLRTLPPPADDAEDARYLTGEQGLLEGELELLRRFDRERGVVAHFEFAMTLRWTPRRDGRNQKSHAIAWREAWSLREVLRGDAAGREREEALARSAIERASAALLEKLGPPVDPSMWPTPERSTSAAGTPLGAVAGLVLLALHHAGEHLEDPRIAAAFERLRATEPLDTCARAAGILALAARAAPRAERAGLRKGCEPSKRALGEGDRELMTAWTNALVDAAGQPAASDPLLWRDERGQSCSERAHLATRALAEAAWCGIETPRDLWARIARHWLSTQVGAGFACAMCEAETSGAGTAIALDALGLCRHFLSRSAPETALLRLIDAAVEGGWRWMEEHYTTRGQPGPRFYSQARRYHTHFALVSAARARGIAAPFGRDLAWETAMHYVHTMTPQDRWSRLEDDAMALLCLEAPPLPPTTPGSGR